MQKIIAIIFLMIFSVTQYGKLIDYWNCKITNSSDTRAVQCDCEKILIDTNGDADATVFARMNLNDKAEDWVRGPEYTPIANNSYGFLNNHSSIILISPSIGFIGNVFQPPKIS